jgi:predicted nucleic acid-binding protein
VRGLFIDTSAVVALAFGEPGHERVRELLMTAPDVFAAPLLEAEFRAALAREGAPQETALLGALRWVMPDRALSEELSRVFAAGRPRGADAWHLATALFLVTDPADLPFLTLDSRQRAVAEALGFPEP